MTAKKEKSAATPTPASPTSQLLKSFLPIAVVIGLRQLPLSEPQMTLLSEVIFGIRSALTVLALGAIYFRIQSKNDVSIVKAHEKQLGAGQTELVSEMSATEYDTKSLMEFAKTQIIQIALILFMYWKWQFVQPLIFSSISAAPLFFDNELVKIHFRGAAIARPFACADPAKGSIFGALLGGSAEQPSAKEVEKVESKKKD